ncbi:fibro-slime domain-containing protein [Lachnospiraceae bacterium KH1T2]|nr:fibro-slime domain-containing protein [Lachnospiraceae bacterium KH1T2]
MFMKGRSKRVLALILSASMIFTAYSTAALADEDDGDIVIEEKEDDVDVEDNEAEEDSGEEKSEESGEETSPEEKSDENSENSDEIVITPTEASGEEAAPTESQTPVEGQVPTEGQAPVEGQVPTEGQTPAEGQVPTEGQTPVEGQVPTEGQTPVEGQVPTEGQTPTEGQVPAEGQTPAEGQVPTEGQSPSAGQIPTEGQLPESGNPTDGSEVSKNDVAPEEEASKDTVSDPDADKTVSDPDAENTTSDNDIEDDDDTVSDDNAKKGIKTFDTVETDNFMVTISYHEDMMPEGVTVKAKEFAENSDEYKSSYETLSKNSVSFDGMVPLDISLIDKDNKEFEPESGAIENVVIESKENNTIKDTFSDAEAGSMKVIHLENTGKGEKPVVVADAGKDTEGTVDVTLNSSEDEQVVEKIKADFTTDSFSTYILLWRSGTNATTYIGFVTASPAYQEELDELISERLDDLGFEVINGRYYANSPTIDFNTISEIEIPGSKAKYVLRCVAGQYNTGLTKAAGNIITAKNNQNYAGKRRYYSWANSAGNVFKDGTAADPGIKAYYLRTVPTIDKFDDRGKGFHTFIVDWPSKQFSDGAYGDGSTKEGLYTLTTQGSGEDYEKFPQLISNHESIEQYVKGQEVYGLFREDKYDTTSYYYYRSTETSAELNGDTFTVYEDMVTPGGTNSTQYYYKRGNFLPFNKLDPTRPRQNNLIDEDGNHLSEDAEKYNWPLYGNMENDVNYEFGFYGYGYFWQPIDGQVSINGVMEDMVYDFVGDDDLLIYIDGTLALDLGGIHDAQNGTINFATGEIKYTDTETGHTPNWKYTTLREQFEKAGTADLVEWNPDKPATFKDGSQHLIQMFYLERGRGASNLNLKFNLPTAPKGSINVSKYMEQENAEKIKKNESYTFKMFVNGEPYANQEYTLAGEGSTVFKTDVSGCFAVKTNQVATFKNIDYDAHVRVEEISSDENFNAQYIIEDNKGNQTIHKNDDWYITPADASHVRVKVDNVYKESKLKITKNFIVDGVSTNEAPDANEFKNAEFLVQFSNDNGNTWGDLKTIKYSDFDALDNSYTVSQAIVGVKYRVVELISGNAAKQNPDSYYANVDGGNRKHPYVNTIAGANSGTVVSSEVQVDEEEKVYEIPFVNEYGKVNRNLIVKKVVSGNKEYMDLGQKFNFTIKITDSDGTDIEGTYGDVVYANGVSSNGSLTFTNGKANVDLGDGDYVILAGLPLDAEYLVTEDTGSLPKGYTLMTSSEDMQGILDEDKTVTVVNKFYFAVPTGVHLPGAGPQGTSASVGLILLSGAALALIENKKRRVS